MTPRDWPSEESWAQMVRNRGGAHVCASERCCRHERHPMATQYAEVTLPYRPLLEASGAGDQGELAVAVNVSRRCVIRWAQRRAVPFHSADRAACALKLHPCSIWGSEWWTACARVELNEAKTA